MALLLSLSLIGNGCVTKALWDSSRLAHYSEPAPDPETAFFETRQQDDIIVAYNEFPESADYPRRRAYLLFLNQERLNAGKKPRFIEIDEIVHAIPIPVYESMPSPIPDSGELFVILQSSGKTFQLYRGNQSLLTSDLPYFALTGNKVLKVALTPVAVLADAALIGGVVALLTIEGWGPLLNDL